MCSGESLPNDVPWRRTGPMEVPATGRQVGDDHLAGSMLSQAPVGLLAWRQPGATVPVGLGRRPPAVIPGCDPQASDTTGLYVSLRRAARIETPLPTRLRRPDQTGPVVWPSPLASTTVSAPAATPIRTSRPCVAARPHGRGNLGRRLCPYDDPDTTGSDLASAGQNAPPTHYGCNARFRRVGLQPCCLDTSAVPAVGPKTFGSRHGCVSARRSRDRAASPCATPLRTSTSPAPTVGSEDPPVFAERGFGLHLRHEGSVVRPHGPPVSTSHRIGGGVATVRPVGPKTGRPPRASLRLPPQDRCDLVDPKTVRLDSSAPGGGAVFEGLSHVRIRAASRRVLSRRLEPILSWVFISLGFSPFLPRPRRCEASSHALGRRRHRSGPVVCASESQ